MALWVFMVKGSAVKGSVTNVLGSGSHVNHRCNLPSSQKAATDDMQIQGRRVPAELATARRKPQWIAQAAAPNDYRPAC